jgi:hypothetical protein
MDGVPESDPTNPNFTLKSCVLIGESADPNSGKLDTL